MKALVLALLTMALPTMALLTVAQLTAPAVGAEPAMWPVLQSSAGHPTLAVALTYVDLTLPTKDALGEVLSSTLMKYQTAALQGKADAALALSMGDPLTVRRVGEEVRRMAQANAAHGMGGRFNHLSAIGCAEMFSVYSEFEDGKGGSFPHLAILVRAADGTYRISKASGLESILLALGSTYPSDSGPAPADRFIALKTIEAGAGVRFAAIRVSKDGVASLGECAPDAHASAHLAVVFTAIDPTPITAWTGQGTNAPSRIHEAIGTALARPPGGPVFWKDVKAVKICGYLPAADPWVLLSEGDGDSQFIPCSILSGTGAQLSEAEVFVRELVNNRDFIAFVTAEPRH